MERNNETFFEEESQKIAEVEKRIEQVSKEIKLELIELISSHCSTYREVNKCLRIMKQNSRWNNNLAMSNILENVENHFENEKNRLTLLGKNEVEIIIISRKDKKRKELFRYGVSHHRDSDGYARVCTAVFMAREEVKRDFKEHKQYAYALIGEGELKMFEN